MDENLIRVDPDAALIERLYLAGQLVHLGGPARTSPRALAEDSDVGRFALDVKAVGFAADPQVVLLAAAAAGADDRPAGQLPQILKGLQEAVVIFESATASADLQFLVHVRLPGG